MYYDAHTHLNSPELFENAEKHIQNFVAIGGKSMIIVGASEQYNSNSIKILKNYELRVKNGILKVTFGLHPEILVENNQVESLKSKVEDIKKLILDSGCKSVITPEGQKNVVAVGECGIDLYYPGSEQTLDLQKELFAMQCDLAQELKLPLVIHSRNAFEQTLDVLKNYRDLTVYFHCWGYGPEEVKRLKNFGLKSLYVGFCGNVTYKKADELRESLKLVGEDQLLLETDAPYLSPQIVRGTQNEPANVRYIYDYVAEFFGKEKNALQGQIEKNFLKVYNL